MLPRSPKLTFTNTSHQVNQLRSSGTNWDRCVGTRDLQIGSLTTPTAKWVAANAVTLIVLRFVHEKAPVEQGQGKSGFCNFSFDLKTEQSSTHSIGPLAATRDWTNLRMVWLRFLWLFNFHHSMLSRKITSLRFHPFMHRVAGVGIAMRTETRASTAKERKKGWKHQMIEIIDELSARWGAHGGGWRKKPCTPTSSKAHRLSLSSDVFTLSSFLLL